MENSTKVDWAKDDRAPLLLIAGGEDHIVPAKVSEKMARRYAERSQAVTDYKVYPGRSHFTMIQDGWEELADYALTWAVEHATAPAPAGEAVPDSPPRAEGA